MLLLRETLRPPQSVERWEQHVLPAETPTYTPLKSISETLKALSHPGHDTTLTHRVRHLYTQVHEIMHLGIFHPMTSL